MSLAALRKPKKPTLTALEEGEEHEESHSVAEPVTTTNISTGRKRLQLTVKNVLLRAQATKVFTDKTLNSILPELIGGNTKLASIPVITPPGITAAPLSPPPLVLNHSQNGNGNIWSNVVRRATLKPTPEGLRIPEGDESEAGKMEPRKTSLKVMLQSTKVKQYVDKVAQKSGSVRPLPQSVTMRQWSKCNGSVNGSMDEQEESDSDHDESSNNGNKGRTNHEAESRRREASHPDYGRNLILAESCRAAFTRDSENRSNTDIQALKTWFQKTRLKTCTDFESLQAVELTLLCRRMKLHAYYPNEVVFKQGDEGDALYIVFSGKVEVRVSQKVMGEYVEVVVCEMGKGEFFGERSLLNNEPRAATVVTKGATELVSICRDDYNVMLKQDQQAFLQKVAAAGNTGQRASQILLNSHDSYIKILKKKPSARSKADLVTLAQFLQTLKFFRGLPKTFVQELCTIIDLINVDANTTIFREGEIGKLFYVILSGAVDVKISAVDKRGGPIQTKLVNLGEGSHFGDLALIKKNGLRSATVISTLDCELLIIAEKDYNLILKKLQKEDMKKRLQLLDRIPIFQSVEWTSELMEELSYVLMEQRNPAGTTIFKQGDKATQVFFLTRGEVIISKTIKDPKSSKEHSVVVERLGPFNVFGDDAATGKHFNEAVFRGETAICTTPIETLVLSKYDVFNRLSKTARLTLRNHTHKHMPSVVVFDQLYKTLKWEEYKRKLVAREINLNRLNKVLPHTSRVTQSKPSVSIEKILPLVEGNDLMLVSPVKNKLTQAASMTLEGYTMHYNPDIVTQDRKKLFKEVNEAVDKKAIPFLDEGNPMVYLDHLVPPATAAAIYDEIVHSSDTVSENFIFSLPSSKKSPNKSIKTTLSPNQVTSNPNGNKRRVSTTGTTQLTAPFNINSFLKLAPGYLIVNFANNELVPTSPHPAFRILGQYENYADSIQIARYIEIYENNHSYRSSHQKPDHPVEFYIVESGRHVLVPSKMEDIVSRTYCDRRLHEIIHDHGHLTKWDTKQQILAETQNIPSLPPEPSEDDITNILHRVCGYAESMHFCMSSSNGTDGNPAQSGKKPILHLQDIEHNHVPMELKQGNSFACISIMLPGDGSEPTICIFGCFTTEADATEYAENGFPKQLSDQALLCVVPMYEWIYFDDASDWCLQMRKSQDRHHLALHKKELQAIQQPTAAALASLPTINLHEAPPWIIEQQQGQRLHQLTCTHMGLKTNEKELEKPIEEEGYTQKGISNLDQKIESLHDILNARHQTVTYGSSIQKMQKVQRFGHIMKLRLQKE